MSGLPDRFEKAEKEFTHRDQPRLSVYQSEGGHINAAAVRQLWDIQPEALFIGADSETNELAFVPADRDAPDSYVFSSDDQGLGGDIRFGTTLEALGIDPDDFEETQYVELEHLDGIVVADLSALVDGEGAGPDTGATVDMPENSDGSESGAADGAEPSTHPDIDPDAGRDEKVLQWVEATLDPGESVTVEASEIADAVNEDGRGIPYGLKALPDGFSIDQKEREPPASNQWTIERSGDDPAAAFDERIAERTTEQRPSKDEVRYWCGICGKGPFQREDQITGHHERTGHAGEVVPRTREPTDAQLLNTDSQVAVDKPPAPRVREWLGRVVPEYRYVKVEDIAIECDLLANQVQTVLDEGIDGYDIDRDGRLLCIDPAKGGGA